MEYKRTMYLLSLLHSAADDSKRERLGELFKSAVISTDEYQKLKKLANSVTFFGPDGADMNQECETVSRNTLSQISESASNIQKMGLLIQQIENELKKADSLLTSVGFVDDDFIAVKNEQVETYHSFYKEFANMICYYLISQFGIKAIRNLTFNNKAGLQETAKLVNQQYGNELLMSYQSKKPLAWKISNQSFNSDNLICYQGFTLDYDDISLSSMLKKVEEKEFYRIAPYLFVATTTSAPVLFVGFGNILGIDINHALSLLDSEIVTNLPLTAFSQSFEAPDLVGAITRALNTDCFCIPPEDIVAALNRQNLSNVVASRKENNRCVICGRTLNGRVACKEHWTISSQ